MPSHHLNWKAAQWHISKIMFSSENHLSSCSNARPKTFKIPSEGPQEERAWKLECWLKTALEECMTDVERNLIKKLIVDPMSTLRMMDDGRFVR